MRLSRSTLACLAAAVLAGLVYLNALNNPFVYDDNRTVVDNGSIVSLRDLRAIVWHDIARPIVNLSYAIDRRVWGPAPFGFHLSSVLLHMLNVALLFHLARRLRGEIAAFAAAALFAVHPLMTQAVGYISGRSELLCAAFFLGALLSARRWLLTGGALYWMATLALWAGSLLSKETAAMFPMVLLAMDWLLLPHTESRDRVRRRRSLYVPLFAIAIAGVLLRLTILVRFEEPPPIRWHAGLDAIVIVFRYVRLLLIPSGQSIFHEIVPVTSLLDPRAVAGVAALLTAIVAAWRLRDRWPMVSFGVFWFLLLLLPSSALRLVDPSGDLAEHRVYLASCGPFLVAGAGLTWVRGLQSREGRRAPAVLAGTLLAAAVLSLSGRTLLRNAMWSSPVMLWSEAADRAPNGWMPRTVLGEALHDAGRHEEAVIAHQRALKLHPGDESIYLKLGFCLTELGRLDEATNLFEELRRRQPDSAVALVGLGIVSMRADRLNDARDEFQAAIALDPRTVIGRQWLAALEEHQQRPAEALRLCEEVAQLAGSTLGNDECIRRNRARIARDRAR